MRQQITPLVHDGVMFLSTNMTNTVQALDARTGDLIWEHRLGPIGTAGQNATRTMALYGNLLFYPATDATLYALDARDRERRVEEQGVRVPRRQDRRES